MSAGTISLIFNLSFAVILIIGFLIGLWRGVKRSAINFVFGIIGLLVAFFCAGPLTTAILNAPATINGQPDTLNNFLIAFLRKDSTISTLITNTPSLEKLIVNLPYAIATTIIFLLLSMAVSFVMYLIYKVFTAIFVKKKDKEGNKLPRHRILGGVLGLVKTFLLMLFVCMPFVSLVGTAEQLTSDNAILADVMPDEGIESVRGFNDSAFGVIGNMFGLDDAVFDYLSKFEIDENTILIREEATNYNTIYLTFKEVSSAFNGGNTSNISFEKLEYAVNSVLNSGLYQSVVSDVLDTLVVDYHDYNFIKLEALGEYKEIFYDVREAIILNFDGSAGEYLANDLKQVVEAFRALAENGALDEILQSEDKLADLGSIIDSHNEEMITAVEMILTTNIVKDSTSTTVNLLIQNIFDDLEKVNVNGRALSEEEWKDTASAFVNILKNAANVMNEADITAVLDDPMSLLAQNNTANILTVLNNLGQLVDNIRSVKILQNDGVSIIEELLEKSEFTLPDAEKDFYDINDSVAPVKKLTNYSQLMAFIAPALQELKDINVYSLLTEETVSTTKVLKAFGQAATKNSQVLSHILLPLIQVEPTKSILLGDGEEKGIITSLDTGVINFTLLNTYYEWELDLGYISNLLSALNKEDNSGKSFLETTIENGADALLKALGVEEANENPVISINEVLKPILYAKSTTALRTAAFDSLASVLSSLTGKSISFDLANITLLETNENDQANEVCAVFEKFLAFYPSYTSAMGLEDINKIQLGQLLDVMKVNAFRTTLTDCTEEGIFKAAFDAMIEKVQQTYPSLELGEDLSQTEFEKLFTELENARRGG